jgi:hypothetical protein
MAKLTASDQTVISFVLQFHSWRSWPGGRHARTVEDLPLLPGQYCLDIGLRSARGVEAYVPEAVRFETRVSDRSAKASTQTFGGVIVPEVSVHSMHGAKPLRCD